MSAVIPLVVVHWHAVGALLLHKVLHVLMWQWVGGRGARGRAGEGEVSGQNAKWRGGQGPSSSERGGTGWQQPAGWQQILQAMQSSAGPPTTAASQAPQAAGQHHGTAVVGRKASQASSKACNSQTPAGHSRQSRSIRATRPAIHYN